MLAALMRTCCWGRRQKFVDEMIAHFKDGKRLPLRYAWQIMLGAHRAFMQEGE